MPLLETARGTEIPKLPDLPAIDCTKPINEVIDTTFALTNRFLDRDIPAVGLRNFFDPNLYLRRPVLDRLTLLRLDDIIQTDLQKIILATIDHAILQSTGMIPVAEEDRLLLAHYVTHGSEESRKHFDDEVGNVSPWHALLRFHLTGKGRSRSMFTNRVVEQSMTAAKHQLQRIGAKNPMPKNYEKVVEEEGEKLFEFDEGPGDATFFVSEGIVGPKLFLPSTEHDYLSTHFPRHFLLSSVVYSHPHLTR